MEAGATTSAVLQVDRLGSHPKSWTMTDGFAQPRLVDRLAKMSNKPTITYDDFARLDLRVATVIAAEPHPNADRLLKLQVDLGDEQRQICAGVKSYYEPDTLVGKQIVLVANLQPRMLRGEPSNGMLLAATAYDGDEVQDVVVLELAKEVPMGSAVS